MFHRSPLFLIEPIAIEYVIAFCKRNTGSAPFAGEIKHFFFFGQHSGGGSHPSAVALTEGADIYQIAKNCRTSVEMIEKYYATHIKSSLDAAAINVRKPRKKPKKDDDEKDD
jgi:hypothetical protein